MEFTYFISLILILTGCITLIVGILEDKKKEREKLPDLKFKIDTEAHLDGQPIGEYYLFTENNNPQVKPMDVSIKCSYNAGEFDEISPTLFNHWTPDTQSEIPSMGCSLWFFREGDYQLHIRFRPDIITQNKDWSGIKYWRLIKIKLKSEPFVEEDRNKKRWELIDISKIKKDGKINGKT